MYTIFKRSWPPGKHNTWSHARKITVDTHLSYEQALRQCEEYNNNRTAAQIRRGTKMEFTSQ